jgi:hypothetical protein
LQADVETLLGILDLLKVDVTVAKKKRKTVSGLVRNEEL